MEGQLSVVLEGKEVKGVLEVWLPTDLYLSLGSCFMVLEQLL